MEIKSSELAKKIGVTRQTVSNWINRDKKIILNSAGKIDTENELNKSFLNKKAPFLYGIAENHESTQHESKITVPIDGNALQDEGQNASFVDLKDIDIDSLDESTAKEYLKIIGCSSPKSLLLTAQYKKASMEADLKKLELQEKLNLVYSRESVHGNFVTLLKIYYEQRRQIPFNSVDEIIKMALKHGESCRGGIVELLDKKFLKEITDATEKLKHLMYKEFPQGEMPENEFFQDQKKEIIHD